MQTTGTRLAPNRPSSRPGKPRHPDGDTLGPGDIAGSSGTLCIRAAHDAARRSGSRTSWRRAMAGHVLQGCASSRAKRWAARWAGGAGTARVDRTSAPVRSPPPSLDHRSGLHAPQYEVIPTVTFATGWRSGPRTTPCTVTRTSSSTRAGPGPPAASARGLPAGSPLPSDRAPAHTREMTIAGDGTAVGAIVVRSIFVSPTEIVSRTSSSGVELRDTGNQRSGSGTSRLPMLMRSSTAYPSFS